MNQNDNQNPARDLQRYVCDYLNDELSSTGVTMLVEDSKNIEFEIQNALKKQGLAAVCMTPTMTYLGKTGNGQAWQCNDLTLLFVEYVPVNRAKNKASFISGFDAAFKALRMLAGPDANCGFGKFCPVKIEQGEDDGLMVVKATFDTYFVDEYIIPPAPVPTTGGMMTADFTDDFGNPIVAIWSNSKWMAQMLGYSIIIEQSSDVWNLHIMNSHGRSWTLMSDQDLSDTVVTFEGDNPLRNKLTWTWSPS